MKSKTIYARFIGLVFSTILLAACSSSSLSPSEEGGIGGTGNAGKCTDVKPENKPKCEEERRP